MLASRFEVGLGSGSGSELGSPVDVVEYLWDVLGDFTAGWFWRRAPGRRSSGTLGFVILARARPESAILTAAIAARPVVALRRGPLGCRRHRSRRGISSSSCPSRRCCSPLGLRWLAAGAGRAGPPLVAGALLALCSSSRSPGASTGPAGSTPASRNARTEAREDAAAWLAETRVAPTTSSSATSRRTSTPGSTAHRSATSSFRAPIPKLALEALEDAGEPLGTGCLGPRRLRLRRPGSRAAHDPGRSPGARSSNRRTFGPFLLVRTLEPTETTRSRSSRRRSRPGAERRARDRRRRAQPDHGPGGARAGLPRALGRARGALRARRAPRSTAPPRTRRARPGVSRRRRPGAHLHPACRREAGDAADEPAEEEGTEPPASLACPRGRL